VVFETFHDRRGWKALNESPLKGEELKGDENPGKAFY
jgi:hypothetical protein